MDATVGSHPNLNTFPDAADVPRKNSPLSKSVGRLISQTFTEWLQQGGNHGNGVVNTTMLPALFRHRHQIVKEAVITPFLHFKQ